jgi:hypothetical protein
LQIEFIFENPNNLIIQNRSEGLQFSSTCPSGRNSKLYPMPVRLPTWKMISFLSERPDNNRFPAESIPRPIGVDGGPPAEHDKVYSFSFAAVDVS